MGKRLQAAIMFTDIVGYTTLMGENEAETLRLLQQNHSIQKSQIEKYHGKLVKEIGDGLMAYFNNPEEAVLCGIEMQKELKAKSDTNVRVGLHWSEIILEDDDIYGDGVNIASRIEPLADPGGIYISEALQNVLDSDSGIDAKKLGGAKLKNVRKRLVIYAIRGEELPEPSMTRFHKLANPRKKFAVLPTILAFFLIVMIGFAVVRYKDHRAKVIQAEASLDKIGELVRTNWRDYTEAYYLAKETEKYIPENTRLKELIAQSSVNMNITTDPPGAEVFFKVYNKPENPWQSLGVTPLDSVQVPVSVFRWKFMKEGYEEVLAVSTTYETHNMQRARETDMLIGHHLHRVLDVKGSVPKGMTRVAGIARPFGRLPGFFIDKFEVSNQQYKNFIIEGGYQRQDYWPELTDVLGDTIDWQQAMKYFVDQTGNPGPSTWKDQNYPDGKDDFPVNGISWYEANAYAHFVGKSLPTKDHWGRARGEGTLLINWPQFGGNAFFAPLSNFNDEGPERCGSLPGLTVFGAYDMAGNVREWCWNQSALGRCIRGGAWSDNPYMFEVTSQANPFDRSVRNGFRCALYANMDSIPEMAFIKTKARVTHKPVEPVSDEQFKMFRVFYDYDKTELYDKIESRTESKEGWILEKITFDAAYDHERMTAYLFLPTNARPPYQTVIYGPGSNVNWQTNSDDIENFFEYTAFLEFIVRDGRAVVFPIIKGSFERNKEESMWLDQHDTHQYTSLITKIIKDYRRCLDYLETRNDVDMDKIAFYGMSWGPQLGAYLTAVDPRIKTNIFYAGGWLPSGRPESDLTHFLPRVNIPTLMINGRFDSLNEGLNGIMHMYNLLGTPEKDKKLLLFDSDHLAPKEDLVRETLAWLDHQFGQVDHISDIQRL